MFRACLLIFIFLKVGVISALFAQAMPRLIPYHLKDKWGYCDSNKNILIKPQWDEAGFFFHNKAVVKTGNYYCRIDLDGKYIIPPEAHWDGVLQPEVENAVFNCHDSTGKWGSIDSNNIVLIPFLYDDPKYYINAFIQTIEPKERNFIITCINKKYGIIDAQNNIIIPFEYDTLFDFQNNIKHTKYLYPFVYCRKDGKYGTINLENKVKIPMEYSSVVYAYITELFGTFYVTKGTQMGVIDTTNHIIVPVQYDEVWYDYTNKGYKILKGKKWGFVSTEHNLFLKPKFEKSTFRVTFNDDSTISVEQDFETPLLLNKKNKVLIPQRYDIIQVYHDTIRVSNNTYNPQTDTGVEYFTFFSPKNHKRITKWYERTYSYRSTPMPKADGPVHGCGTERTYDENGFPLKSYITYNNTEYAVVISTKQPRFQSDIHRWFTIKNKKGEIPYWFINKYIYGADNGPDLRFVTEDGTHSRTFNKYLIAIDSIERKGIMDLDGNILFPRLSFKYYEIYKIANDQFFVKDPVGNYGIINSNGDTLFPLISFKYSSLQILGNNYFIRYNKERGNPGILINKNNEEVFKGIIIKKIEDSQNRPFGDNNYKNGPVYQIPIPLKTATFSSTKKSEDHFYISKTGIIYADSLGDN